MNTVVAGIAGRNVRFANKRKRVYDEVMKNILMAAILVILTIIVLPWINWGKISYLPAETVAVTGEAKSQQKNQIATFSAGVEVINNDKQTAVNEVNNKINALVKSIKEFGIAEADLKTQNMSIYQQEETYYEGGVQKTRKGQWRVNNSVEITLREIDKANDLADLLGKSGATNTWGPNFAMDDTNAAEKALYEMAMKDAREKAESIAKASGRALGKVISVTDGGASSPVYPVAMRADGLGGGGAKLEAGSTTVYKSMNVVFELK